MFSVLAKSFKRSCYHEKILCKVRDLDSSNRGSHRRWSVRKGVLRNFAKFTGKYLCQSLFFNLSFLREIFFAGETYT